MKKNISNALANIELEGFEFTQEQIDFLSGLVDRVDNGELTWNEAVAIVKARHEGKGDK